MIQVVAILYLRKGSLGHQVGGRVSGPTEPPTLFDQETSEAAVAFPHMSATGRSTDIVEYALVEVPVEVPVGEELMAEEDLGDATSWNGPESLAFEGSSVLGMRSTGEEESPIGQVAQHWGLSVPRFREADEEIGAPEWQ